MKVFAVLTSLLILAACDFGSSSRSTSSYVESSDGLHAGSMHGIQHFIDPATGNHTEKLTIPKNYNGELYLVISNIEKLTDKLLYARFKFGVNDSDEVVVPAIIGTGPGLTSMSGVYVLVLDLRNREFIGTPLGYDLFDYNQYNQGSNSVEIASDNRNTKLYCRGLKLSDDPTSNGSSCSGSDDQCLYAYAKIEDQGLTELGTGLTLIPTEAQVALEGGTYFEDSANKHLVKCLNDSNAQDYNANNTPLSVSYKGTLLIGGKDYRYDGPYRPKEKNNWQISSDALFGEKGLFAAKLLNNSNLAEVGYQSYLFPRFGKMEIKDGVEYVGHENPFAKKVVMSTRDAEGKTHYMDGCNNRVSTKNSSNEHIGSCNITSVIEIFYMENGSEKLVTSTRVNDESKSVKLQLVKSAVLDNNKNVLNTGFRTCSSNSACGNSECCFNGRCWSDNLISQCLNDGQESNMKGVNATCTSDFQCASLCCKSGRCQEHNTLVDPPIYCSKAVGETCVASQWCEVYTRDRYFICRDPGYTAGSNLCSEVGYRLENGVHGICEGSTCNLPDEGTPRDPAFEPTGESCLEAIDCSFFDTNYERINP